jgi:spore coat polysaccharide biosynthesis protein SpsF (cytidylyltransferase family)
VANDFPLVEAIYDALYSSKPNFGTLDIIELLAQQPDIPLHQCLEPGTH